MTLEPKPGFDWGRVAWGRPDEARSVLCSYCAGVIHEDDVPLAMWTSDGHAAEFCTPCQREWWGLESFEDAGRGRAMSDDEALLLDELVAGAAFDILNAVIERCAEPDRDAMAFMVVKRLAVRWGIIDEEPTS